MKTVLLISICYFSSFSYNLYTLDSSPTNINLSSSWHITKLVIYFIGMVCIIKESIITAIYIIKLKNEEKHLRRPRIN